MLSQVELAELENRQADLFEPFIRPPFRLGSGMGGKAGSSRGLLVRLDRIRRYRL